MSNQDIADAKIEKIVKLINYGATNAEIAQATGLEEAEIVQVRAMPAFIAKLADSAYEEFDNFTTMNDAWDKLEQMSLVNVLQVVEYNKDPDFNLKVAMLANKAQRRGLKTNKPIQATAPTRTVIVMNQQFVELLQADGRNRAVITGESTSVIEQIENNVKSQDFLNPEKVERMLHPENHMRNAIAGIEINGSLDE
jgi:hypothetical protein